jgi:hypothetical protein
MRCTALHCDDEGPHRSMLAACFSSGTMTRLQQQCISFTVELWIVYISRLICLGLQSYLRWGTLGSYSHEQRICFSYIDLCQVYYLHMSIHFFPSEKCSAVHCTALHFVHKPYPRAPAEDWIAPNINSPTLGGKGCLSYSPTSGGLKWREQSSKWRTLNTIKCGEGAEKNGSSTFAWLDSPH